MPDIVLSSMNFLQVSVIAFQSLYDIFSENFVKGLTIIGLQIFLRSGAMFSISPLSVGITPPDFGSSRDEMVPPVMTIATFGNCRSFRCETSFVLFRLSVDFMIVASRISDSRSPIL